MSSEVVDPRIAAFRKFLADDEGACKDLAADDWCMLSDLLPLISSLVAERDAAHKEARNLTKALTSLTPGGSEYFSRVVILDDYFADTEACIRAIRERFASGHQAKVDRVDERRRAEAAERLLAEAREALRPFVVYAPEVCFLGSGKWTPVPAIEAGGGWIGAEDFRKARATLSTGGVNG